MRVDAEHAECRLVPVFRILGLRTVRGNMRRDLLQGAAAAAPACCPMFNVPRPDHHAGCWPSTRGSRLQTED